MAGTESLIIFKAFFQHCAYRTTERVSMTSGPFSCLSRVPMIAIRCGGHFLFSSWLVCMSAFLELCDERDPTLVLCNSSWLWTVILVSKVEKLFIIRRGELSVAFFTCWTHTNPCVGVSLFSVISPCAAEHVLSTCGVCNWGEENGVLKSNWVRTCYTEPPLCMIPY